MISRHCPSAVLAPNVHFSPAAPRFPEISTSLHRAVNYGHPPEGKFHECQASLSLVYAYCHMPSRISAIERSGSSQSSTPGVQRNPDDAHTRVLEYLSRPGQREAMHSHATGVLNVTPAARLVRQALTVDQKKSATRPVTCIGETR